MKEHANQTIKYNFIENISKKVYDLQYVKEAFLRKYGWDASCAFPDSYWRWVKEIKGQTIATGLDEAVRMEEQIIEHSGS